MSVDAQRFMDLVPFLNLLWSAPLQIILAMYFLWQNLGPSVLAGVALMVLLIPLNGAVAVKMRAFQVEQMKLKDSRIKLMSEILNGIKVLKLYAWEPSFLQQVEGIRQRELQLLRKAAYLHAISTFIWVCSPFLVTLITLWVYVYVDPNNMLDAEKAFVSVSLFNILRIPLNMLPQLISNLTQASVSLKRIQHFLSQDELDTQCVERKTISPGVKSPYLVCLPHLPDGYTILWALSLTLPTLVLSGYAITIHSGTFTWAQGLPPSLHRYQLLALPSQLPTVTQKFRSIAAPTLQSPLTKNAGRASVCRGGVWKGGGLGSPVEDIQVPKGALVAVVGAVGCGKSSLVSALLGEMEKLEGEVHVKGSVAYVPQQAWIRNCTLQENVLFGQALNPKRYQQALEACALLDDLKMLPGGDQTEIGEKGINLSGGQRQRVSLARAVYSNADIFLLDDPLSAVDSHVAKHIFDHVIGPEGVLAGKTRVLVTHGISFLPQTDFIIVLADGQVSEMGPYPALLQCNGSFANFLRNYAPNEDQEHREDSWTGAEDEEVLLVEDTLSNHTDLTDNDPVTFVVQKQFMRQLSALSSDGEGQGQPAPWRRLGPSEKVQVTEVKANGALTREETAETGTVELSVFWDYAKAMGLCTMLAICFLYAGQSAAAIGANVWLSAWTNDAMTDSRQNNTSLRLGVYATLGILQGPPNHALQPSLPNPLWSTCVCDSAPSWPLPSPGLLVMLSAMAMAVGGIQAGRVLHQALLHNKIRSPQSFFDTTPSGRILNRFSKDIYVIDEVLAPAILMLLNSFFNAISTLVVIVGSTPLFTVVILPLAVLYTLVQRFYAATSRQLKRLESVSRSPIYSHFSETVTGASVIRAYNRSRDFEVINDTKVDTNQRSCYPYIISNRSEAASLASCSSRNSHQALWWLSIGVEFVGNCVVLFAALFAVIGRSSLSPGLVGLSVSYSLQRKYTDKATEAWAAGQADHSEASLYCQRVTHLTENGIFIKQITFLMPQVAQVLNMLANKKQSRKVTLALNWMIRMMSDLESNIVAVERVKEYCKTETEQPSSCMDTQAPVSASYKRLPSTSRPILFTDASSKDRDAPAALLFHRWPRGWPLRGEVEFRNYSVRYRPGLDLVLRDLSLHVHAGEKVGIVGRTGAGKSSMTLCLFRILEAAKGKILIDGLNVADIGLHDLRSQLTIIPQDPILFSGTLRMNLDPFGSYSEEDIWRALELSHLHAFVSSQPAGLDFQCSEGGENLR
ncbi:Canalicular multispecific organic anion transporter 2 [Saguinus oedipus]|uniref:Canalicular multispecific organic anion transporter 2 n=1 Tax=Saguinus oedipus TaxID=9490 RepID=A0ABQ9VR90_SAGOE|nr:Canalicular multispecific organic anion transporter 2 [Saguinus oedipus]